MSLVSSFAVPIITWSLFCTAITRTPPKIFLPLFGRSISIEEILITETIEYRWYKSKYLEGVSTSKDSTSRSSTCKRFKALFPIYFLKGSRDSKVSTYEYQGGFPKSGKMATFGNDSLESPYEKAPLTRFIYPVPQSSRIGEKEIVPLLLTNLFYFAASWLKREGGWLCWYFSGEGNFGQCFLLKNLRTSCHKTAFKKVFICSSNSRKNFFKAPIMVASPFCKVCFIMD